MTWLGTWLGVVILGSAACKPTTPAETPADEASATTCEQYVRAICNEAGELSRACQSTRHASELMHPDVCAAALSNLDYAKTQIAARADTCTSVVDRLCADLGEQSRACGLVRADLAALETHECEALAGAYDQVLAELRELDESMAPLSDDDQRALLAGDPPAFGPAEAPVNIVLFSDFECPYCATAAKQVPAIRDAYGAEVRFVFRQFPLSFHPNARGAAEAALAAHAQGQFWAFHDRLFEQQQALDRASLDAHAAALGLDAAAFGQALDGATYRSAVDSDFALGRRVGVEGTPTMFVNGLRVHDPTDLASIQETIEQARQAR